LDDKSGSFEDMKNLLGTTGKDVNMNFNNINLDLENSE
jgi:hypothetical protein